MLVELVCSLMKTEVIIADFLVGLVHSDSTFLVAIDQARYDNGSNCGRSVHIT